MNFSSYSIHTHFDILLKSVDAIKGGLKMASVEVDLVVKNEIISTSITTTIDNGDGGTNADGQDVHNGVDEEPSIDKTNEKDNSEEVNTEDVKEIHSVENDPNFAAICSFIEKFGCYLDLQLDIEKLRSMLDNKDYGTNYCEKTVFRGICSCIE